MNKVCVMGLGYVGLPAASLFANNGFIVQGVDTNPLIVEELSSGRIHIEEVGLRTLVEAAVSSGHLKVGLRPSPADAFIICVPTPIDEHNDPDLRHLFDAVGSILPHLREDNLVVVESTVPPRTTERVAAFVANHRPDLLPGGAAPGKVFFAHCPERVLPGAILKELVENDRVIGGLDEQATALAVSLYGGIVSGKIFQTDATTAEMVKLSENTYRDVNVALSNEFALICEKLGIDVWEVVRLANKHPRVNIMSPGPGVGGHCIAVDPWFIAAEFGDEAQLIRSARLRNDGVPARVVDHIAGLVRGERRPKIACLGAAYKANVGDTRNSPAIKIFTMLLSKFNTTAEVVLSDMHIVNSDLPLIPVEEAIVQASLIVLLTDHREYRELDPFEIGRKVKRKVLFDTRNHLVHRDWTEAGFDVFRLGDGTKLIPTGGDGNH